MPLLAAALIGVIFGTGILLAGMGNPAKVLNFFDIFGTWDPSLAFVLGGALAVTTLGYRLVLARPRPVLAPSFQVPTKTRIDASLIGGSALFGLGWGLVGFCPGGLIPVLALGHSEPLLFLTGLLAGIAAAKLYRATPDLPQASPGKSA